MAKRHKDVNPTAYMTPPDGRLGIIALDSIKEIGQQVNDYLSDWRTERVIAGTIQNYNGYARPNYLVPFSLPRFTSGEAKGEVKQTIRGDDIYIMVDVCNYGMTYKMSGIENIMSPDDHFQDLKRIIGAIGQKAGRINVIMPYLYEARQELRDGRESLDCANMLQELMSMGVSNIITFDTHDARIENAIPMSSLENIPTTYQILKNIFRNVPDLTVDADHMAVVSPDEGGMRRAIYLANVLGVEMGMFYNRRDYSTRNEKNEHPIVACEYLGPDVAGKDIIVIDDMISSGQKMLQTARRLKERNANRIYLCATFGLFTNGIEPFDLAYERGEFDKVVTTNLIYQPDEYRNKPYHINCNLSKYIALIIDTMNHDASISPLRNPVDRVHRLMKRYAQHELI